MLKPGIMNMQEPQSIQKCIYSTYNSDTLFVGDERK